MAARIGRLCADELLLLGSSSKGRPIGDRFDDELDDVGEQSVVLLHITTGELRYEFKFYEMTIFMNIISQE